MADKKQNRPWTRRYIHPAGYSLRLRKGSYKNKGGWWLFSSDGKLIQANMGKERAGIELAYQVAGGKYSRHALGQRQQTPNQVNRYLWRVVVPEAARFLLLGRRWVRPRWAEVGPRGHDGQLLPKRGAGAEDERRARLRNGIL